MVKQNCKICAKILTRHMMRKLQGEKGGDQVCMIPIFAQTFIILYHYFVVVFQTFFFRRMKIFTIAFLLLAQSGTGSRVDGESTFFWEIDV